MDDLQKYRQIRIAKILGTKDNHHRQLIRCPFHNERTPSFVIYPDNSFHCFGCKAHGRGAIDFLMKLGASFSEAKQELEKYL